VAPIIKGHPFDAFELLRTQWQSQMQGVQDSHSKVFRAHWNSTVGSLSFMLETWLL
jgi:hypothetical protein